MFRTVLNRRAPRAVWNRLARGFCYKQDIVWDPVRGRPVPLENKRRVPKTYTTLPETMYTGRYVLGAMTFGWDRTSTPVTVTEAADMVDYYLHNVGTEIDTAGIYADGESERIVGELLMENAAERRDYLDVATKVHPDIGLDEHGFRAQLEASLIRINKRPLHLLYLHGPDPRTPLEDTLATVHAVQEEGLVEQWGMCNYHVQEILDAYEHCLDKGYAIPHSVQGPYNPLNRLVEKDLIPVLNVLGLRFLAYNPLCGGLFTDRYIQQCDDVMESGAKPVVPGRRGRFVNNPKYVSRYWRVELFTALRRLSTKVDSVYSGHTPLDEVAFRWLNMHSRIAIDQDGSVAAAWAQHDAENPYVQRAKELRARLEAERPEAIAQDERDTQDERDPHGILLGASSVRQLRGNCQVLLNTKELKPEALAEIEQVYHKYAEEKAFKYYRGCSKGANLKLK